MTNTLKNRDIPIVAALPGAAACRIRDGYEIFISSVLNRGRVTSRLPGYCILILIALFMISGCGGSDDEDQDPPPTISGSVKLFGCNLPDSMIYIEASLLEFGAPGLPSGPNLRSAKTAVVSETADPTLYEFTISGIKADRLYQLRAGVQIDDCGKIFWRGPNDGLVSAGNHDVWIEGYAARTTMAIFDPVSDEWVGMDQLDFTTVDTSIRELRWRTSLSGIANAELQVSLNPFPTEGDFDSCGEPQRELVYRETLPDSVGNDWQSIPAFDFSRILQPRRAAEAGLDALPGVTIITESEVQILMAGAPVYLRVVPATSSGLVCDKTLAGVHGWLVVGKVPDPTLTFPDPDPDGPLLDASGNHIYASAFLGGAGQGHPTYSEQAYMIVKEHELPPFKCLGIAGALYWDLDPLGCVIVNAGWQQPGTKVLPGKWFYFTPSSGGGGGFNLLSSITSIGSAFASLVTEVISYAGQTVDYFNKLAQAVKSAVVKVIADVLEQIPLACDAINHAGSSCEALVKAGLEAGLVAMGIPPNVPSWEQLKSQGVEYVAAQVATEIAASTGIPPVLTQEALEALAQEALDEIEKKRGNSAGPEYDWVLPYLGIEPPKMLISMHYNGPDPIPPRLNLVLKDQALVLGSRVPVPTQFPASNELQIPISMPINTGSIPPPHCVTNQFGQLSCTPSFWLLKPLCQYISYVPGQFVQLQTTTYDCSNNNYVGIYYRDQWMAQLAASGCITLKMATYQSFGGVFDLLAPSPPYVNMSAVQPRSSTAWSGGFFIDPACT